MSEGIRLDLATINGRRKSPRKVISAAAQPDT